MLRDVSGNTSHYLHDVRDVFASTREKATKVPASTDDEARTGGSVGSTGNRCPVTFHERLSGKSLLAVVFGGVPKSALGCHPSAAGS